MSIAGGAGALAARFAALAAHGHAALAPFVTAGDPDLDATVAVLEALDRAGADLCELGVPYSDPIADGPVIQAAYTRALAAGFTLEKFFAMVTRATGRVRMPILAMVSYSIIFRRGVDRFVADAAAAGLAGLVVPDLPLEESAPLDGACRAAHLALVRLVTPTTPPQRAEAIARQSTGFVYCVSVAGVTGARAALPAGLAERVAWLRTVSRVPVLVGFGIGDPEQVRALADVADGAIVGSALVRRIAELTPQGREALVAGVEAYVAPLVRAARS
ncbi:MAG: tryptophan synthase subunit alpha [Planctomycetaceae bacterium]